MAFSYLRKAQFYETDAMGIVHHSNYIRWFEEARVEYMDYIGYGYARLNDLGVDIAVIGVDCDYRSMTRFAEKVDIRIHLAALSSARMTVRYEVTDAATGSMRVNGETRHGFLNSQTKRPISLKKTVPELYALFEREITLLQPAEDT